MGKPKCNIFWFRRDLRIEDNAGLHSALNSDRPVLPLFLFDQNILKKLPTHDKRVDFIHQELTSIKKDLNLLGSDLLIYFGDPLVLWKKIVTEFDIGTVFTNEDYEPYAIKRDTQVEELLTSKKIGFQKYNDHCLFKKGEILKNDGKPYTVYTPFKRKCYELLEPKHLASFNCKKLEKNYLKTKTQKIMSLEEMGFEKTELVNETKTIKKKIVEFYDKQRDYPAINGTTHLGHHLRFGTISVRKCAQIGHKFNEVWLDEILWRDFFSQILYYFPHVIKGSFKPKYDNIKWLNNKKEFKLWCEGKTGYPLVDAGMRELNATGFMHNRVRMVTASFLVKHLLIDWKWGEAYFAEKLLDFDLSANNGNWQWVAGTGCDAAPYFRIFNPETQMKKFDKELQYVKKWVPEFGTDHYTKPIVDHKFAYNRALQTYKIGLN